MRQSAYVYLEYLYPLQSTWFKRLISIWWFFYYGFLKLEWLRRLKFDLGLFGNACRCDRILWKGEGLKQISYLRGESKFSDHRPVYSQFSVEVEVANKSKQPTTTTTTSSRFCLNRPSTAMPSSCMSKIQAEELLLVARTQSCIGTASRFWVDFHCPHLRSNTPLQSTLSCKNQTLPEMLKDR